LRDYFFDSRNATAEKLNEKEAGKYNIIYLRHEDVVLQ